MARRRNRPAALLGALVGVGLGMVARVIGRAGDAVLRRL